jgi:hypothetical protein
MNNEIKIIDNFLSEEEMDFIQDYLETAKWSIQCSYPGSLEFLMCNVTEVDYFKNYLFNRIKEELNFDYKLEKVYFNGQWFGRDGSFHKDLCERTCLIYINPHDVSWGGFTQIVESENKQEIIPPIQGRLVVFPGNLPHKAYAYSFQECPMRITLAYKLL